MKKFFILILIFFAVLIILNVGTVWLQRLVGFQVHVDKICYPQWINNEQYCYLKVESFYDRPISFMGFPQGFNPLTYLRGPNATFYIYKVNINKLNEPRLIKKITKKVKFSIPEAESKMFSYDYDSNFIFKRLEDDRLVLLIRDRSKYTAYYMNTNGRVLRKQNFDYHSSARKYIVDVSPDGTKLLMQDPGHLSIKRISTLKEVKFSEAQLYYNDNAKWLSNENLIIYRVFSFYAERESEQDKFEVYITDDKKENIQLLYSAPYKDSEKVKYLLLDATISHNGSLLFLSGIGIFKKEDGEWRMIKNLTGAGTNYFYPDISPDAQRIVGLEGIGPSYFHPEIVRHSKKIIPIENEYKLKVIELKDILK